MTIVAMNSAWMMLRQHEPMLRRVVVHSDVGFVDEAQQLLDEADEHHP